MSNGIQKPTNHVDLDHEDEEQLLGLQAVRLANAVAFPMIMKTALELGIVDVINNATASGDAFISASEIAGKLPTKPTNPDAPAMLDRMLRSLASHSILKSRTVRTGESVENSYGIGPLGKFFVQNNGDFGSLVSMFMYFHDDALLKGWQRFGDMMMEGGDSAFKQAHGKGIFEYAGSDLKFNKLANRAASDYTRLIMNKILDVYRGFQDLSVLVDVGGGIGTNLGMITAKYPHIRGINFDLPRVVADAPSFPGVEHVAGDMFKEIPEGDAIYMKWMLHSWSEEDSLKILKNCHKALTDNGRVIIVESIHSEKHESDDVYSNIVSDLDVSLLAVYGGGKERTREEFEALAKGSGFSSCRFICLAYHCWVIEFHKGLEA